MAHQEHILLALYAGDQLLSHGRPKSLPPRIDPTDDDAIARWAKSAWRNWRAAGATHVVINRINPNHGNRDVRLA